MMLEFLGESYYVDFEKLDENINIPLEEVKVKKNEEEEGNQQISIVKYEIIKMMLEVILTEREELDDNLGIHSAKNLSIPFKVAFNTLLRHGIIKHL